MRYNRDELSQDDVIELLRAAGIPDVKLRTLYAGHGLALNLEHLTTFANTVNKLAADRRLPIGGTEGQ